MGHSCCPDLGCNVGCEGLEEYDEAMDEEFELELDEEEADVEVEEEEEEASNSA
jgi:hypothetical protein